MATEGSKFKTQLSDFASQAKEAGLDFLDDFKRQTPFFKARVGVVAGYIGLAALTLIIAPPPGESNPIDVRLEVASIPWGVANKTVIELTNESGDDYEKLMVVVNGHDEDELSKAKRNGIWSYSRNRLRAGENLQLEAKHFSDDEGGGPMLGFTPHGIEVRCNDGTYRQDGVKVRVLR